MSASALAKQCVESMASAQKFGIDKPSICVVTPKGWKAPPKFPRGKIVQAKEDGSSVRYFKAANVLAWLVANGLVTLEAA